MMATHEEVDQTREMVKTVSARVMALFLKKRFDTTSTITTAEVEDVVLNGFLEYFTQPVKETKTVN